MKIRTLDVAVTAIDEDGFGVADVEGRTILVKGAAPAPTTRRVRILKRRRGRWYGLPEDRLDDAARPHCAMYPVCGGCSTMHLTAAEQLALKERNVLARLDASGVAPEHCHGPYLGPRFFYRRRARLGVRHLSRTDTTLVGFRETFGSRVADMDTCPVLVEPLHAVVPLLKRTLAALDARARIPQIELSAGDAHAALVVRHLDPLSRDDRARLLAFEREAGLTVLLQGGGAGSAVPLSHDGPPQLAYRLDAFGVTLAFGALDFVQVNARVNEALVSAAVSWLDGGAGATVLDLFSGIGNFALPIARSGAAVVAVEAGGPAVERATANARANGLSTRVECLAADLYGPLPDAVRTRLGEAQAVLLDPPRTGVGALVASLSGTALERLVYVSCYPETFSRDAAALAASGFRLHRLALFDMFPHTAHVETLGLFVRR